MAKIKPVQTIVDGVNFSARHWISIPRDKAIAQILEDQKNAGTPRDAKWVEGALGKMAEDVKKADK